MKSIIASILILLFLVAATEASFARPGKKHRSKSCVPKVLLPGHSKPIKCTKARKIKNSYF
ncbi:MAG: hypothetical protein IT271_12100 [Chitinophagales bacterium]|nr:hypothetical protein [Chitinophagales bacterium]